MSNNKCVYYKEKEQKSIDGGITWVDTGNFRKGALISTQASQCGSFVTEYRWTKADYVCDNANKYKGYKQQVSHDNGGSWVDTGVVDIGSLIESNSRDCGYDEQWFVLTGDSDFICDGASKYKKKEMKYTRDSGTTWNSFEPQKFEKGDLIAQTSTDCASMKVTYVDGTTKYFANLTSIEQDTDPNRQNSKDVEIYDSVTSIGEYAFYSSKLTTITIPNSVTSIGDSAFWNCENLTGITIPNSVTSIGGYAFQYCESLTSVTLPDYLTSIENGTFYFCLSLTGITIPSNVTSIGYNAFSVCKSLTGITIPNSVTSIGGYAFSDCDSLKTMTVEAVTPPTLGKGAFVNMGSGIQIIYVPAESLDAYKTADGWKDYADRIEAIGTTLSMKVKYVDGTSKKFYNLTSIGENTDSNKANSKEVEIYSGVTSIDDDAFSFCHGLTSITIPNSITSIGSYVFFYCTQLTGITIPDSVTSTGVYVLRGCSNLTSVVIGAGIKQIQPYEFMQCPNLTSLTIKAANPPKLGSNMFKESKIPVIYVPASSVDAYKSASGWMNYASYIKAIPE